MSSMQHRDNLVHIAFDASKDVLVAGVLHPGEETPTIERVFNDEPSIRRFVRAFPDKGALRACYEAGPTGYELRIPVNWYTHSGVLVHPGIAGESEAA